MYKNGTNFYYYSLLFKQPMFEEAKFNYLNNSQFSCF